jgi:ABC-type sulfate/molybdate transport systems ATPase subunit
MLHLQVNLNRKEFQLDVDLQLPEQGITAIFGPSGSGKTSLLRAVAGLEKIQQGRHSSGYFYLARHSAENLHSHLATAIGVRLSRIKPVATFKRYREFELWIEARMEVCKQ